MSHDFDTIVSIMAQRRSADSVAKRRMIDIRDRYNADILIPMPDLPGRPTLPLPMPQFIADAVDNTAMRAASTTPVIRVPIESRSMDATNRAAIKRKALMATWDYSAVVDVAMGRSYRHLCGYGSNCWIVIPDHLDGRARVEVRDPLTAYPDLRAPEDTREPRNIGFVFGRSGHWIAKCYPQARDLVLGYEPRNLPGRSGSPNETLWDMVEWIDEDEVVIGLLGPREPLSSSLEPGTIASTAVELSRYPNRAGMVPCSVPQRVTLDRIEGQVTKLTGLTDLVGRLTALEVAAADKYVFSDMVVFSDDGVPQLLNDSGKWEDGRDGGINLVKAKGIQVLNQVPGPATFQTTDRLERAFRVSSGTVPAQGGETYGALRTGRGIESMLEASIDPRIQELQRLQARSLQVVNEAIVAVEKGYWPTKKFFVFSGASGDEELVEYTPAKHFTTRHNKVRYPFPGTDIVTLTGVVLQALGGGLMSRETASEILPFVANPEGELKGVMRDQIRQAAMASLLAQAQDGSLPLVDLSKIDAIVEKTGDWREAVDEANRLAQERQSQQVEPTAPEAQPGLAMPGQGVEATIPGATENQLELRELMGALGAGVQ